MSPSEHVDQESQLTYPPAAGAEAPTAVRTGTEGLSTAVTTIPSGADGQPVRAYTARPAAGEDLPIVVLISDAYGLHPHAADVARRFAHQGYLVVVPDLLARQGGPNVVADIDQLLADVLQHIPDAQVMADLDACVRWAATAGGDPGRVGVVGFSWGGRWAWLYAAHAQVRAGVVWYGVLDGAGSGLYPPDRPDLFPRHPLQAAAELRAPVLGLYGAEDAVIGLDTVEAMQTALAARGPGAPVSRLRVFEGAPHDFHADYRAPYQEAVARESWDEALSWLRHHGV